VRSEPLRKGIIQTYANDSKKKNFKIAHQGNIFAVQLCLILYPTASFLPL
jgi:hypothetical protein